MSSVHPPLDPTWLPPAPRQSVWPTVIGIITIIVGVVGIVQYGLCAPIGLGMVGALGGVFERLGQSQPGTGMELQAAQFDAMAVYLVPNFVVTCTAAILAIMLLVGGIGLVRRRTWSPRTLVLWGILRIFQAAPYAMVGYLANTAMFQAMEDAAVSGPPGPGQMFPGFFAIMHALGMAGMVVQLLWFWALPVFVLIWFSRPKIRREVSTWVQTTTEPLAAMGQ